MAKDRKGVLCVCERENNTSLEGKNQIDIYPMWQDWKIILYTYFSLEIFHIKKRGRVFI